MIIYGTGAKLLSSKQLENSECPSCQQKTLSLHVFAKYVDVFWVPVFPYSKKTAVECSHCKYVGEEKEIPLELMREVVEAKQLVKTPLWLFIGSFLAVLLITAIVMIGRATAEEDAQNTARWFADPKVEDVHILLGENIEDPAYKYFVYKVDSLVGDSMIFSVSDYVYRRVNDAQNAINGSESKADDYYGARVIVARADFDVTNIRKIIRPGE